MLGKIVQSSILQQQRMLLVSKIDMPLTTLLFSPEDKKRKAQKAAIRPLFSLSRSHPLLKHYQNSESALTVSICYFRMYNTNKC